MRLDKLTYTKPPSISYTDMAIWIDNNIYKTSFDEQMCYEYLYHLANMLAAQYRYFDDNQTYDEFSLYAASKLYLRLTDRRQKTG